MPFAIRSEMTQFACPTWRMRRKLTRKFWRSDLTSRSFCLSASISIVWRSCSGLKPTTDFWVSLRMFVDQRNCKPFRSRNSCQRRRSSHFTCRWNLIRFTARTTPLTIRRHRPESVLQRRQSSRWLRTQLHVHTQSRHPIECHRGSCSSRRSPTRQLEPSIPSARSFVQCHRHGSITRHHHQED